jgi:hypothetical protein
MELILSIGSFIKQTTIIDLLLNYINNIDISRIDEFGYNILSYACWGGSTQMVNILIKYFHNKYPTNINNLINPNLIINSPIMIASRQGNLEIVKILYNYGVNNKKYLDTVKNNIDSYLSLNNNKISIELRQKYLNIIEFINNPKKTDINNDYDQCKYKYNNINCIYKYSTTEKEKNTISFNSIRNKKNNNIWIFYDFLEK